MYEAFSHPTRLARWWGLRDQGHWRFSLHGPDGKDYCNESVFLEVLPNERAVTEHLSDHPFILTITFEATDNATLVRWRQVFDTVEHYQQIADLVSSNEQTWTVSGSKLAIP